ncbi:GtrA family protein [Undibacterium sp.]|uniref:GtrA family protein n=1 Tax=Undibacterium sp. TaxID=1914977 RepID=UPI0025FA91A7|nr:GtrA family protein [Undibacterium sp.]
MKLIEFKRILRFTAVGLSAAAIHYVSVVILVETLSTAPLLANIAGFLISFWMSYFGHRFWTFGDHASINNNSFLRFLATASLGFAMNELLFYLMLTHTTIPYTIALAIAVLTVAISTYFLSRLWAFRSQRTLHS